MYKMAQKDKRDGFDINYYWEYEDTNIRDILEDTEEEYLKIERKINAGQLFHVYIKVAASRAGIELGSEYLHCCLDSVTPELMVEEGLYGNLDELVDMAICEARKTIDALVVEN